MRIERTYISNGLRDFGRQFVFVDENEFNVSSSRGRGYARIGKLLNITVPPRGPNFTLIPPMRTKVGLLYEKYVGGVNVKVSEELLITSAPEIEKASPDDQIVIVTTREFTKGRAQRA